jgi:hypothetical protein
MKNNKCCGTYITGDVTKGFVGREGMQDLDDRFEPLEQFDITLPEFVKRCGLFLKYGNDRIRIVATIDLGSEWMVAEIFASLLGVLRQGGIENRLEVRGNGSCIRSRGHVRHGDNEDVGRCGGRGIKERERRTALRRVSLI